ncbi:MAG TPA: hypothetical protein VMX18_02995 [Candidatus Bipolaricaulota bacterium]|nr:hypothetical protein [Candidatus Bipolaricaulota bacterium]
MILRKFTIVILLSVLVLSFFSFSYPASAADDISLGIAPLKAFFSLEPGNTSSGNVTLSNLSDYKLKIKPRVVAFETIDEWGTLSLAEGDFSDYIKLPVSIFDLEPREDRQITYNVSVPTGALGGKFLAIMFATESPETSGPKISGQIGALVFIEALGSLNKQIFLQSFEVNKISWGAAGFKLSVKNEGNTYVAPFGEIKILDWRGREKEIVPVSFSQVLPDKERILNLSSEKNLFGRYKAQLNLVDDDWTLRREERIFWVSSPLGVILILAGAVIVLGVILMMKKGRKHE